MQSPNYDKAMDLVQWMNRQAALVEPDYVDRMRAAAIAAHLNAKDATIAGLRDRIDTAEISSVHPDAC